MRIRAWSLGSVALVAVVACAASPRPAPATPPQSAPRPNPSAASQPPKRATAVDGELDPGMVAGYVRSQLPRVKDCYERSLRTSPTLFGKIAMRWTVDADGVPRQVGVESNTMPPSAVPGCLQTLIEGWRFPKPPGGSVEVSFPFVFQPYGEAAQPRSGGEKIPRQADITRAINANRGEIKKCYQDALRQDHSLTHGKVTVQITIDTSGQVKKIAIQGPPEFQSLEPCLKDRIELWTFPAASDDYGTEFVYLFQEGDLQGSGGEQTP
jgi:hypothetical protein